MRIRGYFLFFNYVCLNPFVVSEGALQLSHFAPVKMVLSLFFCLGFYVAQIVAITVANGGAFTTEPYSSPDIGLQFSSIALGAYVVIGVTCFVAVEAFFVISFRPKGMVKPISWIFDQLGEISKVNRPEMGRQILRNYMKLFVVLGVVAAVVVVIYPLQGNCMFNVFFAPVVPDTWPMRALFIFWFTLSVTFTYWYN